MFDYLSLHKSADSDQPGFVVNGSQREPNVSRAIPKCLGTRYDIQAAFLFLRVEITLIQQINKGVARDGDLFLIAKGLKKF